MVGGGWVFSGKGDSRSLHDTVRRKRKRGIREGRRKRKDNGKKDFENIEEICKSKDEVKEEDEGEERIRKSDEKEDKKREKKKEEKEEKRKEKRRKKRKKEV